MSTKYLFLKQKVSEESKTLSKDYDKSENDLKALQSVGQVNTFFPA